MVSEHLFPILLTWSPKAMVFAGKDDEGVIELFDSFSTLFNKKIQTLINREQKGLKGEADMQRIK